MSHAAGINDAGVICGNLNTERVEIPTQRGFILENGNLTIIPPLPGGLHSHVYHINSRKQVVGASYVDMSHLIAFFYDYDSGQMINLGTFGGWASLAVDLNDQAQVVGYAMLEGSIAHAFLWEWENGPMLDLEL